MTQTASGTAASGNPRWRVAAILALINALIFVTVLYDDLAHTSQTGAAAAGLGLILRYAIAMVLGGTVAGYLLAGLFGRAGFGGWLLAVLGGLCATALAGLAGGLFGHLPDNLADGFHMADIVPVVTGLLLLVFAFSDAPILIPAWMALIIAAHLWARRLRA